MKKILFLLLFISIYSSPTHASAAVEDEGGLFTGSDKVSGKIFNESCLGCHSGGTPRAPHATTFSAMSADYILETLNGVMSSQSSHLTDKEKVKLAEYISGSPITTNLPEPKYCEKNSTIKFNNNSYTQWGYDRENTRNTNSNIDSQNLDKLK